MNNLKTLAFFLLFALSLSASGQTINESEKEDPYIEVIGSAEKEIIPNEIYIAITIRERHEGKEKITIEKQEDELLKHVESNPEISANYLLLTNIRGIGMINAMMTIAFTENSICFSNPRSYTN